MTLVVILALGASLMTFPQIRAIGATILASAGVAGLVAGIAARPVLENLIAGVQIALSQPIRVDDVVLVEGEFGRIEEITATFVVIRIWDLRRLIVPLTYFIDKPFQNWTRSSARLLGTAFLFVDYSMPIDDLRAELARILNASPLWDKDVCALQVTDTTENTVKVRALFSARNSGDLFDLGCDIREQFIRYVRERFPAALPSTYGRAALRTHDENTS